MIISMLIYICWKIYTELVIYLKILIKKLEIPSKIKMVSVIYLLPYLLQVKVWNSSNGFLFVTFTEHTGGITGVTFTQNGKVIVSASLDGTVRAFDLHR